MVRKTTRKNPQSLNTGGCKAASKNVKVLAILRLHKVTIILLNIYKKFLYKLIIEEPVNYIFTENIQAGGRYIKFNFLCILAEFNFNS